MKKMQSINDPLFKTLEPEKMRKVSGGRGGETKTMQEIKLTSARGSKSVSNDCGKSDGDTGEDHNDAQDASY